MLNLGLNTPISGKCRDKIEILSPHILLSRKFTAVRRKIVTSCPAYFLTHDAADFDLGFKSLKKSPCLTTECSRPSRKIRPLKQSLKTFAGDVSLASRGSCTDRKLFTAWPHWKIHGVISKHLRQKNTSEQSAFAYIHDWRSCSLWYRHDSDIRRSASRGQWSMLSRHSSLTTAAANKSGPGALKMTDMKMQDMFQVSE